jgi:acylphosphatase
LQDGKVEATFEGEADAVKMLIEFCKHGPPRAKVSNVDVTWENYTGESKAFKIEY